MKAFLKQRFPALWRPLGRVAHQWRAGRIRRRQRRVARACARWDARQDWVYGVCGKENARREALAAALRKTYHRVEKGLSLPQPRPGFGEDMMRILLRELAEFEAEYSDPELSAAVRHSIRAYLDFNQAAGGSLPEPLQGRLQALAAADTASGGVLEVSAGSLASAAAGAFPDVVRSRYSIRCFRPDPVPPELVAEAVALAGRSPSACNRQCWRVHATSSRETIDTLLRHQNGNRGFGDTAPLLLIVTADRSAFADPLERHQVFVDGGLFSMTLMLALHHLGVANCPLNLCVSPAKEEALRGEAGIPPSEAAVMMIAAGFPPASLAVARSARRDPSTVLRWIDSPS